MNLEYVTKAVEDQFANAAMIIQHYQGIMDKFYDSGKAFMLLPGSRIKPHGKYDEFIVSTQKEWVVTFFTVNNMIYIDSVAESETTLKNGFMSYIAGEGLTFNLKHHKSKPGDVMYGHHSFIMNDLKKIAEIKPWVDIADRIMNGDDIGSQMMGWHSQMNPGVKWSGKTQRKIEKSIRNGSWHKSVLGNQTLDDKINGVYAKYGYEWLSHKDKLRVVDAIGMSTSTSSALKIITQIKKKQ